MEQPCDFVERLEKDMSLKILMCLEDPRDLAAVSGVSKSWRRFVIENGLAKQLCLKLCPDLSKIVDVVELTDKPQRDDNSTSEIPLFLTRDHRVFSLLSHRLTSYPLIYLIKGAICASSTDRFPEETIDNTLREDNNELLQTTYWSSKGNCNQTIPESLVYRLWTDSCVISEIQVQPFQAFWEPGRPTYCAEAVRFSMGRLRSPHKPKRRYRFPPDQSYDDDMFIWTYTSPEFPMAQASEIQRFRLPRPVLCMGRILKIELLGRVQKNYLDGLYYFCVNRVQAMGRSLSPEFKISVPDDTGSCILHCTYGVLFGTDDSDE